VYDSSPDNRGSEVVVMFTKFNFFRNASEAMHSPEPRNTPRGRDNDSRVVLAAFDAVKCHANESLGALVATRHCDIARFQQEGDTLLHVAARGNAEALGIILDHTSPDFVDSCNDRGHTALGVAVRHGTLECVKKLLKAGADPNALGTNSTPPLIAAAKSGRVDIMRELVSAGADLGGRDYLGNTAMFYACKDDKLEVAGFLIENGLKVNDRCCEELTPLMAAADHSAHAVIKLLLGQNASLSSVGTNNRTALFFAKQSDIVSALVCEGAAIGARDEYGDTPFSHAITSLAHQSGRDMFPTGHGIDPSAVIKLIELGSDVNASSNAEEPPLICLLKGRSFPERSDLLTTMIAHGADVDAKDARTGTTALMFAVCQGMEDVVEELLVNGADVHAQNSQGQSALSLLEELETAVEGPIYFHPIIKSLLEAYTNGSAVAHQAVRPSSSTDSRLQTKFDSAPPRVNASFAGLDLHGKLMLGFPNGEGSGLTKALMMAADAGDLAALQNLVSAGVQADARDVHGRNALFYAAERGRLDFIAALIGSGQLTGPQNRPDDATAASKPLNLSINSVNDDGESVLFAALKQHACRSAKSHVDGGQERRNIIVQLIKMGADINAANKDGITPLMLAAEAGDEILMQTLLEHGADTKMST
jgi:ankyrin repeat protein